IYGDTARSIELSEDSIEDVAHSDEPQDSALPPQPDLERVSTNTNVDDQKYAPHVISTPLAFLIHDALNTNVFGEPGWMGTGWRAARDLKRRDIGGKTGTT
ncbi:peptidoglycan glycosyltransferase/peptidoglycan DD-transpeptidase MrcA, partial [Xenorhabdus bovienii]|nr:peptidoglycan glycosyltransferase/peptidoglycan DD-transpeptidase MrcA [Xenorhabdus bovienii]